MTIPSELEAAVERVTAAGFAVVPLKPSRKLINDLAHEWAYNTEEAGESYGGFLAVCARHGIPGSDPAAYDDDVGAILERAEAAKFALAEANERIKELEGSADEHALFDAETDLAFKDLDARIEELEAELAEANERASLLQTALAASEARRGELERESLQSRVQPWMMACFGAEIAADRLERNDRFIEEALELVQASGYPASRAHELVEYVYGRPQGEINQEVGGVMITLAAHCLAHGVDMHEAGETELVRIWTKVEQIREKQKAKPKGSALPIALNPHQEGSRDHG